MLTWEIHNLYAYTLGYKKYFGVTFVILFYFIGICGEGPWKIVYLTGYQVNKIFLENKFDAVMHFAAVAYVGESTADPLK